LNEIKWTRRERDKERKNDPGIYIRPIQMIQQEDKSEKIETKEEYKYIECMSVVRMLYNF
jgi:hypothetical protein